MSAKVDRTIMPAIECIADFNIKEPVMRVMRNGMKLYIINSGSEDIIRLDIVINSGQLEQKQPLQAMMTNRMLREGTGTMSSAQIAEKLDFYGAWLDLSSSVKNGFITLYSLGKYFTKTLDVLTDILRNPVFPEREMNIIAEMNKQQFLVNSERVEVISRKRLNMELFGENHPLGKFAVAEDYDKLSHDILMEYYQANYYAGNCTVYVSGNVTDSVLERIESCLGNEAWGSVSGKKEIVMPEPKGTDRKRVYIEKKDAMQCGVKIGSFMPPREHEDYLDLKVVTTLLGGYFGSRLMKNIREDKGYTYGIMAGLVAYPDTSLFVISTETANEYAEPVIKEVYNEIDRLKQEKVSKEELNMVKNYMMGDICRAYESILSQSDAWIFVHTAGLKEDFFERSVNAIKNISEERVMELANRYFDKEKMLEVVAGVI